MTIFRSEVNIPVPETDLLSYIFDSSYPYNAPESWGPNDYLLQSAQGPDYPGYTLVQIKDAAKRVGCGLNRLGAQGKNVTIYGDPSLHFPIALLGILAAGASCTLPSTRPPSGLAFYLEKSDSAFVLFAPPMFDEVRKAAKELNMSTDRLFVVDDSRTGENTPDGIRHWSYLLETPGGDSYQWPRLSAQEPKETTAVLFQTSGTTGIPKLVQRTHYGIIGNIEQRLHWFNLRPQSKEVMYSGLKFCGMGYIVSGLLAPLKGRFKAVVLPKYETHIVLHLVDKFRPTRLTLAKFAIQELIKYEGQADFSCLASLMTGGCHMPYELIAAWKDRHNVPVYNSYGMSEGGVYTSPDPNEPVTDTTIGKLQPNVEAIVVNEQGQHLGTKQSGEILFRSPFNMMAEGYYKDPETTAATLTQDGWLKTADIGWVDDEGHWYIVGRTKDQLRKDGNNISAFEIESSISRHPEIADVSVIPVSLSHDEELVPRAYLVKEPRSNLTIEALLDWMDKECSPMTKLHGDAAFIDRIPITEGGHSKVDRKLLSDMAKRDLKLE